MNEQETGERAKDYWTIQAMRYLGGGFIKALAELASQADHNNLQKVKDTWPEHWEWYGKMGIKLEKERAAITMRREKKRHET